jgi:hypothetical protein
MRRKVEKGRIRVEEENRYEEYLEVMRCLHGRIETGGFERDTQSTNYSTWIR